MENTIEMDDLGVPYKAKENPIQECMAMEKIRFFDIFEILWGEISWSNFPTHVSFQVTTTS